MAPEAPSLICLDKKTGAVVWTDNSPGKNILRYQISSPLVVEVAGRAQVIVAQGDGWLRSFDPATGRLLWKCDLNPKDTVFGFGGGMRMRNYVVATPVLYQNRVYVASGQELVAGLGAGCLYCIDASKSGDVSPELEASPRKGKPNPNSAVVWSTAGPIPPDLQVYTEDKQPKPLSETRDYYFGRAIASCTVHDGLVYAADADGYFFCFDATTGKPAWVVDLNDAVVGQPLWADGKVYVCNGDGIFIFAHGKRWKPLASIEAGTYARPGLVFAKGTLYVVDGTSLYAVRNLK